MSFDSSRESLSEALPVPGRALYLRTTFNKSLINSLTYLLEICEKAVSARLFSRTTEKLNSLSPELKLSGFLSALHLDLFSAAQQRDIRRVNDILKRICAENFEIEKIKYINLSDLNDNYSHLVKIIFFQEITREVKFLPLPYQDFERTKYTIQRGFKKFKNIFEDFFLEFQTLVSEVLILNAIGIKQGSSSDFFGIIYKSILHKSEKMTDVIEFLVHEQSHLYIYLLNQDDPILFNPTDKHYSSLRKEQRPLMGIYHAAFILSRVFYVLIRALELNEIPEEEKKYCQELLASYKNCFYECYKTLQTHAKMTPLGEGLILSASKLVQ